MKKGKNGLPLYVRPVGLLAADTVVFLVSLPLFFAWQFDWPLRDPNLSDFFNTYLMLVPVRVFLYALLGLYRTDLDENLLDLLYRMFWVCLLVSGLEWLILLAVRAYSLPDMGISRLLIIKVGIGWLVAGCLIRGIAGWRRRRIRQKRSRILFAGSGEIEPILYREILDYLDLGYSVAGFVGDGLQLPEEKYPVLGSFEQLPEILQEHQVTQVVVIDDKMPRPMIARLLGMCEQWGAPVRIIPSLYEVMIGKIRLTRAGSLPWVEVTMDPFSPAERVIKRVFDMGVGTIVFLILFWLWFLIWILVKLDQRGPALEKLPCLGRGGRTFHLLRFRTKAEGSSTDEALQQTPIGFLLKRLDFDRIPQLLNVIRGELSLVGPRPMTPDFFEAIIQEEPLYRHCLMVKPGVTGLAQIHGQSHHLVSKLRYDLSYINNGSLLLDLKILFQTFSVLITGRKIKG